MAKFDIIPVLVETSVVLVHKPLEY